MGERVVIVGLVGPGPEAERQAEAMRADGADRIEICAPDQTPPGTVDNAGAAAAAVVDGAGLLRTRNVRAVRRAADTITAIAEAEANS